jgi:penicillin-binding protein 1B
VLNFGTAFEVRASGFNAPAAGKTGSSHDAWFAGYTSNLLCIVWVGYDDYSDIRLSGAELAAPIWAEFMKDAIKLPQYRDVKPFRQPDGVVDVKLDKVTNYVATPTCPDDYTAAFVAGTEPKDTCDTAMSGGRGLLSKILGLGPKPLPPPPVIGGSHPGPGAPGVPSAPGQPVNTAQQQEGASQKKKKGLFGKIVGVFKDDKAQPEGQQQHPTQPQTDHP